MRSKTKRRFCVERLLNITNGFAEENFIGEFQFGRVYRGFHKEKPVIVKIWEEQTKYKVLPGDNEFRVIDEVNFHEQFEYDELPSSMARMIGFYGVQSKSVNSDFTYLGAVYDLNALDTVHNLLTKDTFTWPQRIKVAYGVATFLRNMHYQHRQVLPYLLRNLDAAHIMLDQDYNPKIFDISMVSGGTLFDKRDLINQYVNGCHGYSDPVYAGPGRWSVKCDIFSYGVLLLRLLTKRLNPVEDVASRTPSVCEWAKSEYELSKSRRGIKRKAFSLVHENLASGQFFFPCDGVELSKLALQCIADDPHKRPTAKKIVKKLHNLLVVRNYGATLGLEGMIHAGDAITNNNNFRVDRHSTQTFNNATNFQVMSCWLKKIPQMVTSHEVLVQKISNLCSKHYEGCLSSLLYEFQLLKDYWRDSFIPEVGSGYFEEQHCNVEVFSNDCLREFTDGFSNDNLIGKFQFGKVFRGRIGDRNVTVKLWEVPEKYFVRGGDTEMRLGDELILLQHPKLISHPNLVKLIGYSYGKEYKAVVYDLDPLDIASNLVLKGGLPWLQRIKVALGFASLLEFLHCNGPSQLPYLVRNICTSHIILDKDYNPKLLDFGMFTGGILPDRRFSRCRPVMGVFGYIDYQLCCAGAWSETCDIYSYGVVLLDLISNKIYDDEAMKRQDTSTVNWASDEYETEMSTYGSVRSNFTLVHPSLERQTGFYPSDAHEITMLALQCIEKEHPSKRPTMKKVVRRLRKLRAFEVHLRQATN